MKMSQYLITGGAGFIGSHIATELVRQGHKVRILDNLATGKLKNITHLEGQVEFIEGDIRSLEVCQRACEGVEFVSHQGALGSVPSSVEDPITTNDVNITGTLNMLVAARDAGVKKFVFASSSSVYGDTPTFPKVESMTPSPKSPYALSKLAAETYCRLFFELYGLETVALRYFNVFGPRQDPDSQYAAVIPKFCTALALGKAPTIFGDGEQTRDFIFVPNVVDANLLGFASDKKAAGKAYNVACNRRISLNQLLEMLQKSFSELKPDFSEIRAEYLPPRKGDVRDSLADYNLAKEFLKFEPKFTIEDGLKETLKSYL